jgi:hypothetical protein
MTTVKGKPKVLRGRPISCPFFPSYVSSEVKKTGTHSEIPVYNRLSYDFAF